MNDSDGSKALGFAAGFLGGCIGVILVHLIASGSDTKTGANWGFVTQIILGIAGRTAMGVFGS